jgi:TusA-related sulfurtransferase
MIEKIQNTVLDIRGEKCPYPFIRTKWQMEKELETEGSTFIIYLKKN